MLKKWYISTLIIIISLLGIVSQQYTVIPNQEIVLQFNDVEVSNEEVENTIAIVKKQLQNLGVNNVQVTKSTQGKLKITYYSDADIASVKQTLSKEAVLELAYALNNQHQENNQIPVDQDSIGYNFDVYEIHNANDAYWDLNGINVIVFDTKSDHFFNTNSNLLTNSEAVSIETNLVSLTYKVRRNIAIAIDNILHRIPEVRAGPRC